MTTQLLEGDQLSLEIIPANPDYGLPTDGNGLRYVGLTICPDDENPDDIYVVERNGDRRAIIDSSEINQFFEEQVKKIISEALKASGGKVQGEGGAADLLSMNPQTLYSKIRKYGIGD